MGEKCTDKAPTYPAGYEVENVIAVANNTSADQLSSSSNFGKNSVDLAAPGTQILSSGMVVVYKPEDIKVRLDVTI